MAGSYLHCCGNTFDPNGDPGEFRDDLLNTLGDALEACEEMHWMIWRLADGDVDKIRKAHEAFYRRPGPDPEILNPTYRDERTPKEPK